MPTRRKATKRDVRLPSRRRVGQFVKRRRLELKMTQHDVMRALGYGSPISVSEVELGRVGVPFKRIYQYADVLRVPREEFAAFVMGGIQNRNGKACAPIKDKRKHALGDAERALLEDFRRLPASRRKVVRNQVRAYLLPRCKQGRGLRNNALRRRPA